MTARIFISLLALALPALAGVTNITHPAYYSTVHDAVSVAVDGDTLLVSTGRYAPDWISIGSKNLCILGGYRMDFSAQLAESSVLDGGSYVASVSQSTSLFSRLTLTGAMNGHGLQANSSALVTCQYCTVSGNTNGSFGAGIRVISSARVVLENTTVENNATTNASDGDGAGIYVSSASLVIGDGCTLQHNASATRGGGLCVNIGSADIFGATAINDNYAPQGGGIYARSGALVEIHDNADVRGNVAGTDGGGAYVSNATLLAYDSSTFVGYPYAANGGNSATNDGGNVYAINATVIVSNGAAVANGRALNRGGGVFLTNSTLLLVTGGDLGTYNGNYGTNQATFGGGAYLLDATLTAAAGSDIVLGRASTDGGALYARNARISLAGARVRDNIATVWYGGAVYLSDASVMDATSVVFAGNTAGELGGALYSYGTNPALRVTLTGCTITNNSAGNHGGAIRWYTAGTLTAINCTVAYNASGGNGGALAMASYPGVVYLSECDVMRNRANGDGGACHLASGTLIVTESTAVRRNIADADGDADGNGGAVWLSGPAQLYVRPTFAQQISYNHAVDGGAIFARNAATVTVEFTGMYPVSINDNEASGVGGGIGADRAVVIIDKRTSVTGNTAQYGGGMFATNAAVIECKGTNGLPVEICFNQAMASGGGIYAVGSGTVVRADNTWFGASLFIDNLPNIAHGGSGCGGGAVALADNARLDAVNCRFMNNVSSNAGGGLYVIGASADVRCAFPATPVAQPLTRFWNNTAKNGGAAFVAGGALTVLDAGIVSNRATATVGGIACFLGARGDVVNCVFAHNTASNGAALASVFVSAVSLVQCTIAQNATNAVGTELGGVCALTNCIVWDNAGEQVSAGNIVRFSDIQDGYLGAGNFSADPLFAAPGALDFQLTLGSPCLDTGTPAGVTHDILGVPRPYGAAPDPGAYEFMPEPGLLVLLLGAGLFANVRRVGHVRHVC